MFKLNIQSYFLLNVFQKQTSFTDQVIGEYTEEIITKYEEERKLK